MYSIVVFPSLHGNEKVEIVSSNWINGNICYWPPFTYRKLKTALERQELPDRLTWKSYEIRILREFQTLSDAEKMLPFATQTSDLSCDEDTPKHTRNIQAPARFLDTPPSAPKAKSRRFANNTSPEQLPSLPIPPANSISTGQQVHSSIHSTPSFSQNSITTIGSADDCIDFNDAEILELRTASYSSAETQTDPGLQIDEEFKKKVLQTLKSIEFVQKEHDHTLKQILSSMSTTSSPVVLELPGIRLPVNTTEDLLELDRKLGADADLRNTPAELLKRLGGSTISEGTGIILAKLMTDALASQYSWHGQRHNLCFKELTYVNNAIFDSLTRNPLTAGVANLKDMRNDIGEHLRRITDREHKRQKKEQQFNATN